ncbi:GNAT family N-acetyltransferase [Microbacterium sp.]|jgi:ribosomal protein S18 acetylase RimI-like enzyme|uniref:GNAT family N-acetyltransferase n=1 Tax=Microbacterium sp. TaxID=51671 RepID=UPI002BD30F99|nr:GNAT family N-acetyltransferase [Microbacterium sp.]HWL79028.1 GNAT family N-acetyltransferase [Microbacterium sp.]
MLSIRRVRADEWEAVRDLRLESLSDPLAPIAFLDTRAGAEARSDDFWRDRTARAAESDDGAQLVAEDDGEWVGSLTVLLRRPGGMDHLHRTASHPAADVVGVWVRPTHRGDGTIDALLDAAVKWALAHGAQAVSLDVHVDNHRAQNAYRRFGFRETGEVTQSVAGRELRMTWQPDRSESAADPR